jgi:hypothetical protein
MSRFFRCSRFVCAAAILLLAAPATWADAVVEVTSQSGLSPNSSISWTQLGGDQTQVPATFSVNSSNSLSTTVSLAGANSLVSVVCAQAPPLSTNCSWNGAGFTAGDSLLWAVNAFAGGNGPVTLAFASGVEGTGALIQSDVPGQFTASIQAFAGGTPLATFTETSDAAGDAIYLGVLDSTGANITSVVYSLTACAASCADFAVDAVDLVEVMTTGTTTSVGSSLNPSVYGQAVTLTATINGANGNVKGRVKQHVVSGTVAWSANTGCGTTAVTSGDPGVATCSTSALAVGTDTITATYSGDGNHSGSSGTLSQTVNSGASTSINVTSVSPAAEDYGSTAAVLITALLSWSGSGAVPTAADVTIGGNSNGTYGATSCGALSGTTLTCTATLTPSGTDLPGSYTETASFSGDTNYTSSSSPQTNNFTINVATSSTSVASSPNPSTYASPVTFTATINGENGAVRGRARNGVKQHAVTGTVTWSANTGCGTTAVTANPDNSGTATCTTSRASSLEVGTDTVTATYSGDSNHSGSAGSVNQVVQGGIATTIDVTSVSPASEDYGSTAPVTITAVLTWTGNGKAPTGSDVTIGGNGTGTYGATSCAARVHETITCTATFTAAGTDTPGSYTETATFSGDSNYSGSSSPETNNFTINQANSTTAVSSSQNPSGYGQSVTLTATINGENGNVRGKVKRHVATGTVAWSPNTGCGTTAVTSGNPGVATCTTSALPAGTDTITATYSGDGNHSGSSGTLSQTVNSGASTSINVTSVSPAAEDFAADLPATITAVLSWTGSGAAPTASDVSIGGNGNGSYGATSCGSPSGNTMTCTATYTPTTADSPGSYTETASFSGDTNYTSSSSGQTNNFTINIATSSTSVASSPNPSTYASPVTFTATINGENGAVRGRARNGVKQHAVTGTVTWSANTGCGTTSVTANPDNSGTATCTTSSLAVGTDTISATYSGDSNHSGSSGTLSGGEVVNQASTITAVTSSANPSTYGESVSFTASVASNGGTPKGMVHFKNGTTSLGTVKLLNGSATLSTSALNAGSLTITAHYDGSGDYASSSSTLTQAVDKAATTNAITSSSPNPSTYGQPVTFTAAVSTSAGSAGGEVEFMRGNLKLGSGTLSSGTASYTTTATQLPAGQRDVTAVYRGDANHLASTSAVYTQTVKKAATTTVAVTSGSPSTQGSSVTFTATVSSSVGTPAGNVAFTDGTTPLGTVTLSGGTAQLTTSALAVGRHTIHADYQGNGDYAVSSGHVTQRVVQ